MRTRTLLLLAAWLTATACGPKKTTGATGIEIPMSTESEAARAHYLKGRDYLEKLRFVQARGELRSAVETDPMFAIAWLQLSVTQPSNAAFFDAVEMAKKYADRASPAEQWWIEGFAAGITGDTAKQMEMYKKVVDAHPKDVRAHALLGNAYFGTQQYEKAIEVYKTANTIDPTYHAVYNQLGYAHRFLKQYDQAESAFKKYIEVLPDDPNPHDSYAELKLQLGDFEEAIASYRNALKAQPGFTPSHIGIATCLNYLGKHKDARAELEVLHRTAIDDGMRRAALHATAISYADQGHLEDAIEAVKKSSALAKKIDDASALSADRATQGLIYMELGDYAQAASAFAGSLKIVMDSDLGDDVKANAKRTADYNITRVHVARGELDKAKHRADVYRKASEALGNPVAIQQANELDGLIAVAEKRYDDALEAFNQANPQSPFVMHAKLTTLKAAGRTKEAEAVTDSLHGFNALNSMPYSLVRWRMRKRTRADAR